MRARSSGEAFKSNARACQATPGQTVISVVAVAIFVSLSSHTTAAIIDFESQPSGAFSSVVATVDGITLTATSTIAGAFVHTDNPLSPLPPGMGSHALIGSLTPSLAVDQFTPLRMDFSTPLSFVSLIVGDGGGDDDGTVRIRAFNAANAQIGSSTALIPSGSAATPLLSITASGISYILADSFGGPNNLNSVFWDNVTVVQPVPEPGICFFSAFAGLIAISRRPSRKVVTS